MFDIKTRHFPNSSQILKKDKLVKKEIQMGNRLATLFVKLFYRYKCYSTDQRTLLQCRCNSDNTPRLKDL